MTVINPDDQAFPLAAQLAEVEAVFIDLKSEMRLLQARLRDADAGAVKDVAKISTELRSWLRIAYELEANFHERQRQQAGIQRGYAVDFDQARDQIRCRLDRLRRCGHAKPVSG